MTKRSNKIAAATGATGTFLLAAAYGKLNWTVIKKSLGGAFYVTIMVFTILIGAYAFTQILIFSGAGRGMVQFITALPVHPLLIFIAVQLFGLLLGMFMVPVGVMSIIVPLFIPLLDIMGFDPIWFAVILMLNVEMGTTSPPFGHGLYIMRGVAPPDTTMGDIYRSALPFLGCDLIAMALLIAFPQITLWLPNLMH